MYRVQRSCATVVGCLALVTVFSACGGDVADRGVPRQAQGATSDPETATSVLREALDAGEISLLDAHIYQALGPVGGAAAIPERFRPATGPDATSSWAWHVAPSYVLAHWDEVAPSLQEPIQTFLESVNPDAPVVAQAGLFAGSGPGPWTCQWDAGDHVNVCSQTGDANGATMQAQVLAVATQVWNSFDGFFGGSAGASSRAVQVVMTDLENQDGYYVYGFVPFAPSSENFDCHIYLDNYLYDPATGSASTNAVPGTLGPNQLTVETTIAHELFHCFQHFIQPPSSPWLLAVDNWLWEGTAMWGEHLADLTTHSEWAEMGHWVVDPHSSFLARQHDAVYPYLYADLTSTGGPPAILQLLVAASTSTDPAAAFGSSFIPAMGGGTQWHQVSIKGWNATPIERLAEGTNMVSADPYREEIDALENEDGAVSLTLESYSRFNQQIHLLPNDEGQQPNRLFLDLTNVAAEPDLYVSALVETEEGWLPEPVDLTGEVEVEFCVREVGPCAQEPVPPHRQMVGSLESVVLIFTSARRDPVAGVLVPWDAHNPHLHGRWRRTGADVAVGQNVAPFQILGTQLVFDEIAGTMQELTAGYFLVGADATWECQFGGAYEGLMSPEYELVDGPDAMGTVGSLAPGSQLAPWQNDCVFTAEEPPGFPGVTPAAVAASSVHVPVIAAGPQLEFGFEIQGSGDTLVVTLPFRTYTYERTSSEP